MDVQGRKMCEGKKIEYWWEEIMRPKSITSSFSWTDPGWREAELPQLGNTSDSHKHCFPSSRFGKKCFFYQVQESEWVLPAPHYHCSSSMGKLRQQHIITGSIQANTPPARGHRSHNPTEIIRGCVCRMAIGVRGCICFPQPSRRMLIRVQGFSTDNRRLLFLIFEGLNYKKPKEWIQKPDKQQVSKSQAVPPKCFQIKVLKFSDLQNMDRLFNLHFYSGATKHFELKIENI